MNALSLDLRQRIFNYSKTHSIRQTAEVFQVSPDTVYRLKKLHDETGGLEPKPCRATHWKAVSEEGEMYLKAYILEHKDATLEHLCEHYQSIYGVRVGITTMHNALKRIGLTRKKKPSTIPISTAMRTL
jgi:transposase